MALTFRSCDPRIPIKKKILNNRHSKNMKKVKISCAKKHPFNKNSKKKKKNKGEGLIKEVQDHIVQRIKIKVVKITKIKDK